MRCELEIGSRLAKSIADVQEMGISREAASPLERSAGTEKDLVIMKPVLVIYATREGHTRHIAEDLGATLGAQQRPT
jgi:hypothetical protein